MSANVPIAVPLPLDEFYILVEVAEKGSFTNATKKGYVVTACCYIKCLKHLW